MVMEGTKTCPNCGGALFGYDTVKRMLRSKNGEKTVTFVKRLKCRSCGKVHRAIPENVEPGKRYEKEIIEGVREGLIDSSTLGFEDYPSEITMRRWSTHSQ